MSRPIKTKRQVFSGHLQCKRTQQRTKLVSLYEYRREGETICFKLDGKKYRPMDLYFIDQEEIELMLPRSSFSCSGYSFTRLKRYNMLSLFIHNSSRNTYTVHEFFEPISPQQRTRNRNLQQLYDAVKDSVGPFRSWFVEMVQPDAKHSKLDRRVRLVVSSHNISLLSRDHTPIQYHTFKDNSFDVMFDETTFVLSVHIHPFGSSEHRSHCFKVISTVGLSIRQYILDVINLHGDIDTSLPSSDTGFPILPSVSGNSNQVINWVSQINLEEISNPSDHADEFDDELFPPAPDPCPDPPAPLLCVPAPTPHRQAVEQDERLIRNRIPTQHDESTDIPVPPRGHLIRAESFDDSFLSRCTMVENNEHVYMNVGFLRPHSGYEDDNPYYRVYYENLGWIKTTRTRMVHKIRRRSRLSEEMKDVDFKKVNQHEQWYELGFLDRHSDPRYARLSETYLKEVHIDPHETHPKELSYEVTPPICDQPTLPPNIPPPHHTEDYWNSNLCLTVQKILESRRTNLAWALDITFEQVVGICVHLSVEKQAVAKDWRHLASLLGLSFGDIEIIQHFCYTYREWPANVVLSHWKIMRDAGKNILPCSFDNLKKLIAEIGREDILRILNVPNTNIQMQINFFDEETWL